MRLDLRLDARFAIRFLRVSVLGFSVVVLSIEGVREVVGLGTKGEVLWRDLESLSSLVLGVSLASLFFPLLRILASRARVLFEIFFLRASSFFSATSSSSICFSNPSTPPAAFTSSSSSLRVLGSSTGSWLTSGFSVVVVVVPSISVSSLPSQLTFLLKSHPSVCLLKKSPCGQVNV